MNFNKNGYYGKPCKALSCISVSKQHLFEPEILVAWFTHVGLWFEAKTLTTQIKFFFNLQGRWMIA